MSGASSDGMLRVAVLKGGVSGEREVSLATGAACGAALREAGYEVVEVDCGFDLPSRLADLRPDVCFNALHGRWGEDGCVQGLLEWMRLPYTHSGPLASALAMDKQRSKAFYRQEGLPTPPSRLASASQIAAGHLLPPPYVVKPNAGGSSLGIHFVLKDAARAAPAQDQGDWMVEALAPGRELTVSVLGARALCVTEITTDGWYDYDAKYKAGGSRHHLPAALPPEVEAACLDYALRAHRALGCRGISRTDLRWDEERGLAGLVLLETNSQPGMTKTSLSPEQAAHAGISMPELCAWLVEDASCDR